MLLNCMTISNGLNNLGDYRLHTHLLVRHEDLEMHKTGNLEHPTCLPIINSAVETMMKNASKLRSNLILKPKTFLNKIKLFNLSSWPAVLRA